MKQPRKMSEMNSEIAAQFIGVGKSPEEKRELAFSQFDGLALAGVLRADGEVPARVAALPLQRRVRCAGTCARHL